MIADATTVDNKIPTNWSVNGDKNCKFNFSSKLILKCIIEQSIHIYKYILYIYIYTFDKYRESSLEAGI